MILLITQISVILYLTFIIDILKYSRGIFNINLIKLVLLIIIVFVTYYQKPIGVLLWIIFITAHHYINNTIDTFQNSSSCINNLTINPFINSSSFISTVTGSSTEQLDSNMVSFVEDYIVPNPNLCTNSNQVYHLINSNTHTSY